MFSSFKLHQTGFKLLKTHFNLKQLHLYILSDCDFKGTMLPKKQEKQNHSHFWQVWRKSVRVDKLPVQKYHDTNVRVTLIKRKKIALLSFQDSRSCANSVFECILSPPEGSKLHPINSHHQARATPTETGLRLTVKTKKLKANFCVFPT